MTNKLEYDVIVHKKVESWSSAVELLFFAIKMASFRVIHNCNDTMSLPILVSCSSSKLPQSNKSILPLYPLCCPASSRR